MTENTIHETADAIRSLFIEIQYCLKMRMRWITRSHLVLGSI